MSNIEKKEAGLFDKIKDDMLMEVIEGAIPKIKPFLEPAMVKMNEWFGEDEKLIVIRKNKGQSAKVIIFDNKKGEYEIRSGENKIFTADKECIVGVFDIEEFMSKMITGDISKMISGVK
jgi:hypothetical protein